MIDAAKYPVLLDAALDDIESPRELTPLPDLPPVPPMGEHLIPEPLREWIKGISKNRSCPIEYPAATAITALGAAIGTKVAVVPKARDRWFQFPNLYTLIIGNSGSTKTPSIKDGISFLEEIELDEANDFELRKAEIKAAAMARDAEIDAIKQRIKQHYQGKHKSDSAIIDIEADKRRIAELEAAESEDQPRRIVKDSTVEMAGIILAKNPNGLLSFQDEIVPLLDALANKERERDRQFYLEAANGTGSHSVDRVTRGSLLIRNQCLSVLGGAQPSRLAALVDRTKKLDGADGLLPRFTIAVYPDIPPFEYIDTEPEGHQQVRAIFRKLCYLNPTPDAFDFEQGVANGRAFVRFSPEAQEFFKQWLVHHKNRIRAFGTFGTEIPVSHLEKYSGTLPKIALILELTERAATGDWARRGISLNNVMLAAEWMDLMEHHARRMYASSEKSEIKAAKRILREYQDGSIDQGFTVRCIYRKHWSGLTTMEEVNSALRVLTDYGYITFHQIQTGGRPREMFYFSESVSTRTSAKSAKSYFDYDELAEAEAMRAEANGRL